MKKIKIGIIGCGTIGSEIAKTINEQFKESARLTALSDIDEGKAKALREKIRTKPLILDTKALIKKVDLVVEAASAKVSGKIARWAISQKKDIMIMSVGGIIKDYAALFDLAQKNASKVYIPSGAICGLDGIKAASLGRIDRVELITRKPPIALEGAPYIKRKNINLNNIKKETTIFEGNALEAIEGFPANINVSCALSIVGIGPKKTVVKIVACPGLKSNIHEILIEGRSGKLFTRTENVPSPGNPKTSFLAVLSALATLKQILEGAKVGT